MDCRKAGWRGGRGMAEGSGQLFIDTATKPGLTLLMIVAKWKKKRRKRAKEENECLWEMGWMEKGQQVMMKK